VPLVALHLRRDQRPVHEVPSLLLWQDLEAAAVAAPRRMRLPRAPLLLLLQALALILLVLALARPVGVATVQRPVRVLVLDDSFWMGAGGRLGAAERRLEGIAAGLGPQAPVAIIVAAGEPRVLYRGDAAGVARALARVRPTTAPGDLGAALQDAAGLAADPRDRVVLVRAPEDPLPRVIAARGRFQALAVGPMVADQGIFSASARCGIGATGGCEVFAVVRSTARTPVVDRYTGYADSRRVVSGRVLVGARSSRPILLAARPGEAVRLRLDVRDRLAADNQAWVSVPGPGGIRPTLTVTLVGTRATALPVAQALAAVPGVHLRLRTPQSYRPRDARGSDLLVLDRWLPSGPLPPAPSVWLVDPPRFPGGARGTVMGDTAVSGNDPTTGLLSGVDLTSLAIDQGAASRLPLPRFLQPVFWSPDGALLAAGDDGRQRVAVMTFDPARSQLPQLASFPILAANLVRWAAGWATAAATSGVPTAVDGTPGARILTLRRVADRPGGAGTVAGAVLQRVRLGEGAASLTLPRPGLYAVTETGPGVRRTRLLTADVESSTGSLAPVDLTVAAAGASRTPAPSRAPWLLAAALVVVGLEWALWTWTRSRAQAT